MADVSKLTPDGIEPYTVQLQQLQTAIGRGNVRRMFGVALVFAATVNDHVAMVLTYRYRIVQEAACRYNKQWPSGFDLINLTSGSSRLLGLHSDTVQAICKQLWLSRPVEGEIRCGSFAQDARGRWYLNLDMEVREDRNCGTSEIGIDLGLRTLATLSTGEKIAAPRLYRKYESTLAIAQRAGRKPRVRSIHAKIANCRRHFLHGLSAGFVRQNRRIYVGNVNSCGLARTSMAKSVLDAGWSQLRFQLRDKAIRHGAEYIEVDERLTTQVCSVCSALGGPKGREDLVVREWSCSGCGARHDRDINSAINILFSGRNVGLQKTGIPSVREGKTLRE